MINWIENEAELDKILEQDETVIVDFTAPAWCRPCQQFAPHFEAASEAEGGSTFIAVDVDKAPWAMANYGVQGVPTVKQFVGGEYVRDLKARRALQLVNEINS